MTTQISTFNFKSFPVRIHVLGSEPFFCLLDVASVLGLCNRSVSKFKFNPQGVEKLSTPTTSGDQEMIFINEPNLYRVIFRSNKPEAVEFQNWVFEEVLPQIRKTGKYQLKPKQFALPEPEPSITFSFTESELRNFINTWMQFTRFQESVYFLLKAFGVDLDRFEERSAQFNYNLCKQNIKETHPTIKRMLASLKQENRLPLKTR
ncbi:BRO-N domain-containing protein [Histophilus somni]|uniref:BRO-N domain-containing protein n=1 Tax=Histophilus somni TaxID=731 RepID=UPI00201EFA75|nr:BRO family protein [Histophilus somni]